VGTPRDIRPAIVLTGFGPFPGVKHNPSADLAEALAGLAAKRFAKKTVVLRILPTEWAAAPKLLAALYAEHKPAVVLHFGVSQRASGYCIETLARNEQSPACDAAGQFPHQPFVTKDGPRKLDTSIPAKAVVRRLTRLNVPATVSTDAGTYLCNSILYQSLQLAGRAKGPVKVGFVHIPAAFAAPFDFETALTGGIEIVRTGLGLPTPRSRLG